MDTNSSIAVPTNVTLNWAIPASHNGSGGVSKAYLNGTLTTWSETKSAPSNYKEHFLCPDIAFIMATKGGAFTGGSWSPGGNYYLLQPKGKYAVTLSNIITYLQGRFTGSSLVINWTCCRSPVGAQSQGKLEYTSRGGVSTKTYTSVRPVSKHPNSDSKCNYYTGTIGTSHVTLVAANASNLDRDNTWR